jgi:uncharacterized protein YdeI (YjbR/CyaY-like superfamily)
MKVTHFKDGAAFRAWLHEHHATATELQVGFFKKNVGKAGMSYREAVDEALCFGWIDGIIRSIDEHSYTHRFTPRKPSSIWSNANVGHVTRLIKSGKMEAAGLRAFEARKAGKVGIYSFEQKEEPAILPPGYVKKFKAHRKAWKFFSAQAPWYQRLVIHKITTAKREATREAWLDRAIKASAAGVRVQ